MNSPWKALIRPRVEGEGHFFDGEVMYGTTHGYAPERKDFFIFPADKESNNERVFVITGSTDAVETWR